MQCELKIDGPATRKVGVWTKLTITGGPSGTAGSVTYRRITPAPEREVRTLPIRTNTNGNRTLRCKLELDPPGAGPVVVVVEATVTIAEDACSDSDDTRVLEPLA